MLLNEQQALITIDEDLKKSSDDMFVATVSLILKGRLVPDLTKPVPTEHSGAQQSYVHC